MFGEASSSQYGSGLRGSGALSHAFTQYPPLSCSIPGSIGLYYDDANKLLLCPASNQVFSWKVFPFRPHVSPTSDLIGEGPILSIRYSLDLKILAVQRSTHEVEFWNRENMETFTHRYRPESESILGLFWTDYPSCDIVFVKTSGLDLFSYDSGSRSLLLVETKKLNVSWYVYTHESRLVLLASGMQCKSFSGFQLSSAGITCLPRFEMTVSKSEANTRPVLVAEDVHIVTLYGRIYCLQVDRIAMQLRLYRFYRDGVVQQGSLPIYSSSIAVSVVDNLLLVHQVDAKVVILYDMFANSRAPISAPLPLQLRGFPEASTSSSRASHEAIINGLTCTFLVPDLVYDAANGFLWKIHLDLEAISASCLEVPSVLEFLQRRKLEAHKAKQLCLRMVRTIILERRPVSLVVGAINVIVDTSLHSLEMGDSIKFDKTSASGMPHSPNSVTDKCASTVDSMGKHITVKPSGRVETETAGRPAAVYASGSKDIAAFGPLKFNSGDNYLGGKAGKGKSVSLENSCPEVKLSFKSQPPGPTSNNPLNVFEPQEFQVTSAAVSPDEIYSFIFAPIVEEMAGGDTSYLVAIIVEYIRSVDVEKIKLHPKLFVLTIQLLARNQRFAELELFIINKVLEPSKEVALQLLESGRYNLQVRKLGLDMMRQLSLHHDYIMLLLQDGYYLEALRYARKNKVTTLQPSLFLDAAFASNDSQHLAAVLRFISEFISGFRNTSDHGRYYRILNEMNSSAVS